MSHYYVLHLPTLLQLTRISPPFNLLRYRLDCDQFSQGPTRAIYIYIEVKDMNHCHVLHFPAILQLSKTLTKNLLRYRLRQGSTRATYVPAKNGRTVTTMSSIGLPYFKWPNFFKKIFSHTDLIPICNWIEYCVCVWGGGGGGGGGGSFYANTIPKVIKST